MMTFFSLMILSFQTQMLDAVDRPAKNNDDWSIDGGNSSGDLDYESIQLDQEFLDNTQHQVSSSCFHSSLPFE